MIRTTAALDWLAAADLIQARRLEAQVGAVCVARGSVSLPLQPHKSCQAAVEDFEVVSAAAIHLLCRGDARPRLAMPKKDFEAHTTRSMVCCDPSLHCTTIAAYGAPCLS
jgi:hypothetical protein